MQRKEIGSSSVATKDEGFLHTTPDLAGGDLRRGHSACVCATSSAGTPMHTEQGRSGEELLWLFASTKKP
jgi:hypothetical protein